jgi:hypothetical protein
MPNACPERDALAADDVAALGRALLDAAHETGYLPADLRLAGAAVGLGSAYGALAQAYARAHGGREMGAVRLEVFPRYPAFGAVLARTARSVEDSPMVWPGLGTDRLALHTRLQTWTLKPATRTA